MSAKIIRAGQVLCGFDAAGAPDLRRDAAILVEGDAVVEIGDAAALGDAHPEAEQLGGDGYFAMPGLVNAHHHVGLTPLQLGSVDWVSYLEQPPSGVLGPACAGTTVFVLQTRYRADCTRWRMRWIMRSQREDEPARKRANMALIRAITGATRSWALARIVSTVS